MKIRRKHILQKLREIYEATRDVDIRVKILLPSLAFLVLPYLTIVFLGNIAYKERMNKNLEKNARARRQQISQNTQMLARKALSISRMFASMEKVQKAYKVYYSDTTTELQSSMMLQYDLNNIFKQLSRDYGNNYKFHFFVPPAKSFLRSWNNNRLDDVSSYRKGVLQVINTKDPVTGLEVGINGLMIRGITPVFSNDEGRFLGAIETMVPVQEIIDNMEIETREDFALYIKSAELNEQDQEKASGETAKAESPDSLKAKTKDLVVADYTAQTFNFDIVSEFDIASFLNSDKDKLTYKKGNRRFYAYKILNFKREVIGSMVYQLDISNFIEKNKTMHWQEGVILFGYLVFALLIMLFVTSIIFRPLRSMLTHVDRLLAGEINQDLHVPFRDQIGQLGLKINSFVTSLRRMVHFSDQIVNGNFTADFQPMGENDYLGNSLIALRDNLKQAREEEEARQEEDRRRSWFNEGKTRINETIRKHTKNLNELADSVIKDIINYLEANQGAFFVVEEFEDENDTLELYALYAYDTRRYEKISVQMGEGLIGMAAQDHLTVYRTNIPRHFVRIRSGLGEAPPTTLIIIPLVFEEKVYGALELASFKTYDDYQIQFLEELGETIASAISNLKNSQRTELLLEQSRRQARELASKEEQMRSNLERMEKAEKEAKETEERTLGIVNAFNAVLMRANFQLSGALRYANPLFLRKMNYLEREVEAFSIDNFLPYDKKEEPYKKFKEKWNKLIEDGNTFVHEAPYKTRKATLWIHGLFSAVKDSEGNVMEILFIGFDIDKDRRANIYYKREANAVDRGIIKTIYKPDGVIVSDNAQLFNRLGYDRDSMETQNVFDLMINEKEEEHFRNIWDKVLGDEVVENLEMVKDKDDKNVWFKGVYTPIKNEKNNIDYIVFIGVDVSDIMAKTTDESLIPDYLK